MHGNSDWPAKSEVRLADCLNYEAFVGVALSLRHEFSSHRFVINVLSNSLGYESCHEENVYCVISMVFLQAH